MTPVNQPAPKEATTSPISNTYNYYYYSEQPGLAFLVQVISGVFIVLFAGGQVYFFWRTRDETQRAANAAADNAKASSDSLKFLEKNAEATGANAEAARQQVITLEKTLSATEKAANAARASADAALRSERPVLVVERFIPHNIEQRMGPQGERTTFVDFWIRNCGKGPALSIELASLVTLRDALPDPPSIGECSQIPIQDAVIQSGGEIPARVKYSGNTENLRTSEDTRRIETEQTKLFIYGVVFYRDIHRGRYETRFACEYRPPVTERIWGSFQVQKSTTATTSTAPIKTPACLSQRSRPPCVVPSIDNRLFVGAVREGDYVGRDTHVGVPYSRTLRDRSAVI